MIRKRRKITRMRGTRTVGGGSAKKEEVQEIVVEGEWPEATSISGHGLSNISQIILVKEDLSVQKQLQEK